MNRQVFFVRSLLQSPRKKYTGRENDADGLYFYRARYYSPQFGRFVSEDPIGFRGGTDLYQYTNDNPVDFRDPLGRDTIQVGIGVQGTIGIVGLTGSAGVSVDSGGGVAIVLTGGFGAGTGLGGSVGAQVGGSTAANNGDLGDGYASTGVEGGTLLGGSADIWGGNSPDGPVLGGTATYGLAGGGGSFAGGTDTVVIPLPLIAGRFCVPSNEFYNPPPEDPIGW